MNKKELDFILQEGEGFKIEFKESLNNIDKELVAFANAEGGKIFLGIGDDNKIKGIKISNKLKSQLQDIANNCDPSVKISFEQFDDILIINVEEGEDKPYKCSSGFYLRQGPNSQKLTRDEIFEFATKAGKVFFDELPCEKFNFEEDFDNKKFELFLKRSKISNVLSVEQSLINLHVANEIKNKLVINNAGAMLFSKELKRIFYHTVITCVRFKGGDRATILDRKDFNDDILNNIENAIKFVLQYLPLRYEIEGVHRREYYEIPEDAIREAVVNAVVHRDYFEKGANVQINIFDDKIEITNPGGLVAGLNKKDFGKKSMSRNPLLLSILSKTELVEKVGSGIRRIKEALQKHGLKEPLFEFNGFFTITFLRPEKLREKTREKTREKIIRLIKERPLITIEELAEEIGLGIKGIEWNIKYLKQKGLLKRIGPDKGGHWEVVK